VKHQQRSAMPIRTLAFALAVAAAGLLPPAGVVHAQANWVAERAVLPRGTTYEMRKPNEWNGTLISDLDFAQSPDAARYLWLLNHGYAISGTARRADRATNYDPAHEIIDLVNVMDLFEAKFGKPKRTIQYGHSGGGFVALAMAEQHPDRIHGAVAGCAHVPVWLKNSDLDAWFVLRTLIAPQLQITNIPASSADLSAAWRAALTEAQQTPIGRARIALAITVGQLPAWVTATIPEPNPDDVVALQNSMFTTVMVLAGTPGGVARAMFERSAPGQLSWNDGIDYKDSFRSGDEAYQRATRKLYDMAGASLASDLRQLKHAERVKADPLAIRWWSYPGRTVVGEPRVPVMRIHTSGDPAVLPAIVQGYDAAVKERGHAKLYRTAFVHAPGHCSFTPAEVAASIETLMRRLDTGKWESTGPDALNALGQQLDPSTSSRFFKYEQVKYNRAWTPTLKEYLGKGVHREEDSRNDWKDDWTR